MRNSINLVSVIDTFVNSCSSNGYNLTVDNSSSSRTNDYTYYPVVDRWMEFNSFFDSIKFPTIEFKDTYPPSNLSVDENGTFILQVAVTGFEKDKISVQRKGTKLIIKALIEKSEIKSKEIWKKLKIKDFEVVYQCPEEINLDQIEVSILNGILEIKMPLKEEEQPIELKIK